MNNNVDITNTCDIFRLRLSLSITINKKKIHTSVV